MRRYDFELSEEMEKIDGLDKEAHGALTENGVPPKHARSDRSEHYIAGRAAGLVRTKWHE